MNRQAPSMYLRCTLLLFALLIVVFAGCKEDPPVAPPVEPTEPTVPYIRVITPRANDLFEPGSTIVVTWDTVAAVTAADSVYIEYRRLDGQRDWTTVRRLPIQVRSGSFAITDDAVRSFEIRVKASREDGWHLVSPLYILKPVFTLLSPRNDDTVEVGGVLEIRWSSDAPGVPDSLAPRDDTEVLIEYRIQKVTYPWVRVGSGKISTGGYNWRLPTSITSDFALRVRPATSETWINVTPLHISTPVVNLTSPITGSKHRMGSDIEIEWNCVTPLMESDEVELEYYLQGSWYAIGTFPYNRRRINWKPPFPQATTFDLGVTLLRGGVRSAVYSLSTADLRFDFPAGTAFPLGAPLDIPLKIDLPWNDYTGTELLLSTDGGRTWPITRKRGELLDGGPSSNCRLRARRSDLPFEDTSAAFSITDNLVDYDPLVVGRHYQYSVAERDFIIFAGSISVGGYDHPDLHIIPIGMREFSDRTEIDVTVWGGRNVDTLRTVVTIAKGGLGAASASFLPWSFVGLFTRLDQSADGREYAWKDKWRFTFDRSRGLVFAVGPGVPSVSMAFAADYIFYLK